MELLEKEIYNRYMALIAKSDCINNDTSWLTKCGRLSKSENECFEEKRYVQMEELLDLYDVFCFDGYGTLYNRGDFVYPYAAEWFRKLRAAGKQLRLITNAASDVDEVLAADARKRGFDFSAAETISSGSLLKDLADVLRNGCLQGTYHCGKLVEPMTSGIFSAEKKWRLQEVYYIGRETGKHVLESCGIKAVALDTNPQEPIVAVSSAKDTPESYSKAVEILQKPGAILLVLNSDAWAPKIDGSREPVSGALAERLRRDSVCDANGGKGCRTFYLGKPFPEIWEKVRESLPVTLFGGRSPRVLMVGDTLGTDILGAKIAGFDSALVVGRNQPAEELEDDQKTLGIKPDWYL